jgi:tetratricopeptide (TPR) repeat protein
LSASTVGKTNVRPIPEIDETKQSPKDVIASLTRAIGREQTRIRGHYSKESKEKSSTTLITLYLRRCEILYKIGAYDASAQDARRVIEFDKLLKCDYGDTKPYSTTTSADSTTIDQQMGNVVTFRAEALCSLGYALLRSGGNDVDDAKAAFQESAIVARKMLNTLDSNEDSSSTVYTTLNDILVKATDGTYTFKKLDVIKKQLTSDSDTKDYVIALDHALELCPGDINLHLMKVFSLIRQRRWYHVAHYCERLASHAAKWEGIFTTGDLADMNPLFQKQYTPIGCAYAEYLRKSIPPLSELTSDFFIDKVDGCGIDIPPHLRNLSPKATRDVVFRLPHVLLPHYLRALRLEERYVAAVKTGAALSDFMERLEKDGNIDNKEVFESNKRLRREFGKLDRTIKLKEEADSLFKETYYDRAVLLYGQCLAIDGENERRERSILRKSSSWPVSSTAVNPAGGRLHAVLHFNRSACFYALGRQEDAIKEATYAIEIHSTYMKAILRRAKCYAKKALVDYERFIMLVNEARKSKYPSLTHGSACYFALPSEVSQAQLVEVQRDIHLLKSNAHSRDGFTTTSSTTGPGLRRRTRRRRKFKPLKTDGLCLCCKTNIQAQVVGQQSTPASNRSSPPIVDDTPRRRLVSFSLPRSSNFSVTSSRSRDSSSVRSPLPQSGARSKSYNDVVKPRPPFDRPVDATSDMDVNVDYYSVLGLSKTASESDIKTAYRQFAKEYHPDRSKSKNEDLTSKFHNVTLAYTILGDSGKKKEYDEARAGEWDC